MPVASFKDIEPGTRFGRLTVLSRADNDRHGRAVWNCRCDCGSTNTILGGCLRKGVTVSCRCYHREKAAALGRSWKGKCRKVKIQLGDRFNRLVVISRAPRTNQNAPARWNCKCDCGNMTVVDSRALTTLERKSCGCLLKEYYERLGRRSNHQVYNVWRNMLERCNNSRNNSWKDYGGRGIKVCPEWSDNTTGFLRFVQDMGERPTSKHELDRIDVDGNYEAPNCRWATRIEHAKNKRNRRITEFSDNQIVAEYFRRFGKNLTVTLTYAAGHSDPAR